MKILLAVANSDSLFSAIAGDPLPALALELGRAGHEVSLVTPLNANLAARLPSLKVKSTGVALGVPLGANPRVAADVLETRSPGGSQTFLIRQPEFFERSVPNAVVGAASAPEDFAPPALFAKLVVELARRLNPAPDIVQAQDWPGALALVLLRAARLPFASILTLPADLSAQGSFPVESFGLLNLPWEWFTPATLEFFGRLNCLKGGLAQADALVADGETDRRALQTAAHGSGLDGVLREHAGRLHPIINGLNEAVWNPAVDKLLPRKYRPAALAGKRTSANVFLAGLGLAKNPAAPVFLLPRPPVGAPSHLAMLAPALDQLLADDTRLLILGGGPVTEAQDEPTRLLEVAARKFPSKVAMLRRETLDDRLTHGALAAADFLFCLDYGPGAGAALLRALRYGVVPVLPAGGGLETMVEDYQPAGGGEHDAGHALIFREWSTGGLLDAVFGRARTLVTDHPARWEGLRQRAMMRAGRFNWSRTAAEYAGLYGRLRGR